VNPPRASRSRSSSVRRDKNRRTKTGPWYAVSRSVKKKITTTNVDAKKLEIAACMTKNENFVVAGTITKITTATTTSNIAGGSSTILAAVHETGSIGDI
jgi:hypothetical protein